MTNTTQPAVYLVPLLPRMTRAAFSDRGGAAAGREGALPVVDYVHPAYGATRGSVILVDSDEDRIPAVDEATATIFVALMEQLPDGSACGARVGIYDPSRPGWLRLVLPQLGREIEVARDLPCSTYTVGVIDLPHDDRRHGRRTLHSHQSLAQLGELLARPRCGSGDRLFEPTASSAVGLVVVIANATDLA